MAISLNGGNLEKFRKLNPYKRIQKGNTVNITVDGQAVEAIVDMAGKYTYLNVGGVDYYVSAALAEGAEYVTAEIVVAPKKEPATRRPRKAKAAEGAGEGAGEAGEAAEGEGEGSGKGAPPRRRRAAATEGASAAAAE